MALTPLLDVLHAVGEAPLATAEYRGVETAACFSDPRQEFSALANGCGVYDLGFRTRLSLKGGDRARWMNGMVTNNIRDLAVGRGVYAFLLNPQGRILGDMDVFNRGETLIVETNRTQLEKITATFDHYIIMDDVEVADISAEQSVIGLSGPKSRQILNAVGIQIPELQPLQMVNPQCICDCGCVECTLIRGEDAPHESYEIWLDHKDLLKTWKALVAVGATPMGSEALEMQRITAGIPLYGVDIRERDLPQETGQDRALNFSKGCYVGQEIVERIRSRGNVHRKFAGFVLQAGARVIAGDKIFSGEKEVGEVTSVAAVPAESGEQMIALGYIRREVGTPGLEVTIGTERAMVAQLPLTASVLGKSDEVALHNA